MPQEIRVLQCFSCHVHQVDIVKKTNKWQCKLCGTKQSILKEFLRGSGSECRLMAQQLNLKQGKKTEQQNDELVQMLSNEEFDWEAIAQLELQAKAAVAGCSDGKLDTIVGNSEEKSLKSSKWESFV